MLEMGSNSKRKSLGLLTGTIHQETLKTLTEILLAIRGLIIMEGTYIETTINVGMSMTKVLKIKG